MFNGAELPGETIKIAPAIMIFSESRFRGNAKPKNEIHTIRCLFLYDKFYSIPYALNIAQSACKLSAAKVTN
jgi:hypothetical protein